MSSFDNTSQNVTGQRNQQPAVKIIHPEQISDPIAYTLFCMQDIAGFHISRCLNEAYTDLVIDYNKIDIHTPMLLYRKEVSDKEYTFGSFLLAWERFEHATDLMTHLIKNKFSDEEIKNALQIKTINNRMKALLFSPINLTGCGTLNALEEAEKSFLANRNERDECFALIASTIGAEAFFAEIFGQPNQKTIDLKQKHLLNPKSKQAQTVIDICLQYGLPKTAVVVLRQVYAKSKNHQDIIDLIGGDITKSKLRRFKQTDNTRIPFNTTINKNCLLSAQKLKIYQEKFQAKEYLETIEPFYRYLIETLPIDLCYEHVLQQPIPYNLKSDFDLRPAEPSQTSTPKVDTPNSSSQTSTGNNPQPSKISTPLKQGDFLQLLDSSVNNR